MEERDELIRNEVVLYKANGSGSTPLIHQGSWFGIQLWFWLILLTLFTILLAKTNYKQTVTARGILQPSRGTQQIASPVNAMLRQVHVEPGDAVSKGQALATLSTTLFDDSGRPQRESEIRQFQSVREYLIQQMNVQSKLYASSVAGNDSIIESLYQIRINLVRQAKILDTKLQLSNTNLRSIEYLRSKSNISQAFLDQQRTTHLNLRLQQEDLNRRVVETNRQLSELKVEAESIDFKFQLNQLKLEREVAEIDHQVKRLTTQQQLTVLAEDNGIVAAVAVDQGKAVRASQALFSIHPAKDRLLANLYVPARIQARLFPGQEILLSYDAFDYQHFGRYTATVSELNQASLDPRQQLLPVPGINEPVFKVAATPDQQYVEGPDIYALQAGMSLTADFVVSQKSLLGFIFEPILRLRGKAW